MFTERLLSIIEVLVQQIHFHLEIERIVTSLSF